MASEPLPGDNPLTLYRGDTRDWQVSFFEDDGVTPITEDLSTGHTFLATVRGDGGDGAIQATFTVTATAPNVLRLQLPASEAVNLAKTDPKPRWDVQVTRTSDGFVRTYLAGAVTVLGDVSRA